MRNPGNQPIAYYSKQEQTTGERNLANFWAILKVLGRIPSDGNER